MLDMKELQTDYLSIPARQLIALLSEADDSGKEIQFARDLLENWDFVLNPESIEAAIYVTWEKALQKRLYHTIVPLNGRKYIKNIQVKTLIDKLTFPSVTYFGDNPIEGRDQLLLTELAKAVKSLERKLGPDIQKWHYGQNKFKHVRMKHPMGNAVSDSLRILFEPGPLPRGGYGLTVASTGSSDNQPSGGTFRIILDTGNWDRSLANNSPGQSGDPNSPFYNNLFQDWARDKYFPLFYTRKKVEEVVEKRLFLVPK